MTPVKFSNSNKGNNLRPFLGDVFDSVFNTDSFISDRMTSRVPAVNIAETDNEYQIHLAAPGLKKDDFKINLEQNLLSVSAENVYEKAESTDNKKYSRVEYSYNSFVRTFTLPDSSDYSNISAEYTDGILKINVAKKEDAKIQSREIAVS